MSDKTATVVIGIVTIIWAGNILAGVFAINGYTPSESVNGIFMTIVGGAFIIRNRNRGGDEK